MRRSLIAASAASLVVACSLITSFDGIGPQDRLDAAAGDAAPDAEPSDEAGCRRTRWPDRPLGVDPGGDVGDLTAAVTQLRILDPAVQGKSQGFDLDGLCTCPDRPACAGNEPNKPCDLDGGVDNASDSLFQLLAAQGVALDDTGLKIGLEAGQYGVVMRLSGYNGRPDDPEVNVAVYNAFGVNGEGGVPRGDGTDSWTVDTESLLDSRFPAYFSNTAYVAGGVLVAPLTRLVLRARLPVFQTTFALFDMDLRSAYVVAHLGARTAGGGVTLEDGRIAGRIPVSAVLAQAMRSGACQDSGVYQAIRPVVCAARDLPLDPAKDGRDEPCDSLSFGFGFVAAPALIGPDSGTRTDTSPCPVTIDQCP